MNAEKPLSRLVLAQLLSLFDAHSGFVPGRELVAEGFEIPDLIRRGLICKPLSHLDGGCFLMGPALPAAVRAGLVADVEEAESGAGDEAVTISPEQFLQELKFTRNRFEVDRLMFDRWPLVKGTYPELQALVSPLLARYDVVDPEPESARGGRSAQMLEAAA